MTKKTRLTASLLLSISLAATSFSASAADLGVSAKELNEMRSKYARPKEPVYPKENPYSDSKAALGKDLFFDPRLSASGTQSCATCHNPALGWQDGMALGTGHGHNKLGRHTPTILNLSEDELFFWDGRADSLEAQALGPMASVSEMNMPLEKAESGIRLIKGYAPLFKKAFPEEKGAINRDTISKAIATFERTVVSGEAPFDKWVKGDEKAISDSAKRGFVIFNKKGNCAACHSGWRFSDGSFHDIGIDDKDVGRGKILQMASMQHAFKTMGLRNIAQRGPYMHDGSLATLEEVIEHYNKGGSVKRDSLDAQIKPLHLNAQEKQDLVAFLDTLTSKDKPVTLPALPK
ncbi:MAG TPA: cytochrome c peroxidase [Rickettsiales bacterium]|nr:cytochrome c peroxidase [Rickettsiales bacterium]